MTDKIENSFVNTDKHNSEKICSSKQYAIITAIGFYNNSDHKEVVYMPVDIYEKIKTTLYNSPLIAQESDNKNSKIKGNIKVEIVNAKDLGDYEAYNNPEERIFFDIAAMIEENTMISNGKLLLLTTRDEIKDLNEYTTIKIKRSQLLRVNQFINMLNGVETPVEIL